MQSRMTSRLYNELSETKAIIKVNIELSVEMEQ